MGKLSDRISTAGKKATGGVKNVVSKATDDAHRETEGDAQPLKGTGQDVTSSVNGALGDKV